MARHWKFALALAGIVLPPSTLARSDAGDEDRDEDGYTRMEGDCDDERADTWPGAREVCFDERDQDCNGNADDACMFLDTTAIQLAQDAGTQTYDVYYPTDADETLAFLAVDTVVERTDDQCDFRSDIADLGDRYRFTVTVEHCGTGTLGRSWSFGAQAVVMARIGGDGGFTSFDMDSQGNIGSDHRVEDSVLVPDAVLTGHTQLGVAAAQSSDGEADVDTEWSVTATLEDRTLTGTLYENHGNSNSWVGGRYMALGLGDNLDISQTRFACGTDSTVSYEHEITTDRGDDHAALVVLRSWDTDTDNHLSIESSCSLSGTTYTCSLTCYGSGSRIAGDILWVDGAFR